MSLVIRSISGGVSLDVVIIPATPPPIVAPHAPRMAAIWSTVPVRPGMPAEAQRYLGCRNATWCDEPPVLGHSLQAFQALDDSRTTPEITEFDLVSFDFFTKTCLWLCHTIIPIVFAFFGYVLRTNFYMEPLLNPPPIWNHC